MSLTLNQFKDTFKKFGKIIYMSQLPTTAIADLKKAHMGLVDQQASGLATEFEINQDVVGTLGTNVKSLTDSLGRLPAQCKAAASSYLNKYVAVDLGLSANPTNSALQSAITTQMGGVTATVPPSGVIWTYFHDNLNISLPMAASSGAASIPDTYVSDTPL